jgi:hypothetical protein
MVGDLSTDQSLTKKLRSDYLVDGGQAGFSMRFLKGWFQKLRSDHLVVGAQDGRWTRGGINPPPNNVAGAQLMDGPFLVQGVQHY